MRDYRTEPHVIINDDRTIEVPKELRKIAVQFDHNVETVTFDCPRYWDGLDMSEMTVYVNYMRADRNRGMCLCKNVAVDDKDDKLMHFTWTLTRNATLYQGKLVFLVCIKNLDENGHEINHWNSELCDQMQVSEGLECEEAVNELHQDIITDLLLRMDKILIANTPILDKTLTERGLAADAKATGDAINKLRDTVDFRTNELEGMISNEFLARRAEVAVERERINNLIVNPGGSTDGNTELMDVRVAGDANVYPTAGEAVRSQFLSLRKDLKQYDSLYKMLNVFAVTDYVDGAYIDENGNLAEISDAEYKCSEYIDCTNIRDWHVLSTGIGSAAHHYALYDSNKKCVGVYMPGTGSSGEKTVEYSVYMGVAHYIRFCWHGEQGIELRYMAVTDFAEVIEQMRKTIDDVDAKASIESKVALDISPINMYFLDYSGSAVEVSADYYYISDFIELDTTHIDVQVTNVGNSAYNYALYDNNQNCIGAYSKGTGSTKELERVLSIDIPINARYIRFCWCHGGGISATKIVRSPMSTEFSQTNPLYGKVLIGLGDSLMTPAYTEPGTEWLSLIGNRNNMTVRNYALSGNPISVQEDCMAIRYADMDDFVDPYIVVMGGANDLNISAPIGTNSDKTVKTFKGALNVLIDGLIKKYPRGKILFCTNYKRYGGSNEKAYVDAMVEICALHSIPCHNNYTSSGCHFDSETWMGIYGANPNDITNKHLNGQGDARVSTMYEALLKAL